ncbi:hypothetical protein PRIPAC_79991 [Pristionchus pacificus]|uniref:Uncharacterized protein n=1 Tax=Pristionchus pacificus TaxID=54126 RepID=A0A2A6CPY2_PRIPA|nr:hypothetical protein PRIPAC_79991 [Pristionchus pacificus]|eukprot:PDM80103.1 hypothetical protein PRIPAC_32682 [Pristionchus pacificus]
MDGVEMVTATRDLDWVLEMDGCTICGLATHDTHSWATWILGYWMDPRREIGDWIDVDTEDGKGLGPGSGDSPTTQG